MAVTRTDVLLIGIDAACRRVLDPLIESGSVPNLAALCADGVSAPLESQIPPWTPSAWPSMYTGVNPGKHGVFGFVDYDGYDWHVVTADHVREHAIWELADRHGLTSVVVNVPVTAPPADIDGAIVPGFIAAERPASHPQGILEELEEAIGEYRVYPRYARGDRAVSDAEKMDEYRALIRMRGKAYRYLADRFEPNFGFVQFQKPDTVFHEFDGDEEKVRAVYEETDEQIGEIIDHCDPRTIFLASDHGIGPYEKYEFRVNEHLRREGFVETTTGGKGMPSWNPIRDQLRDGVDEGTWEPGMVERIAAGAAKFGITANRVGTGLRKVGLDDVVAEHVPSGVVRTANEQVDFPNSKAYMRARTEVGVRINLEGREPSGVVSEDEYESVRDALIETLSCVRTPDGEPVFEDVAPREKYFHGPWTDGAVDVVTVPNRFEQFLSAGLLGDRFSEPSEPWNHRMDGLFVAAGEGVDTAVTLENPHLFDVAPTIMAALGLPYSDRMDGHVLPVVAETNARTYPPYAGDSADGEHDEAVTARLSDLGYLE